MSDNTPEQNETAQQEARDSGSILAFLAAKKVGTAMWVMRWYTVILSIQYMFFCSAFEMGQYFQRAIVANAVVCALRLHQRVPQFRFSREHLALLTQEDSCHYLIFSMIFLSCHPITIALMPVIVFGVLHASSFTRQIMDMHGSNSYPFARKIINHIAKNQAVLFRFTALNEILLMPTVFMMLISGRATLFAPFLYYKFLQYRYLSRRNPYSRMVFYELRMVAESMSRNPNCPQFLASLIIRMISAISNLAPSVQPEQQQQQ
uniref:Transmembrane protein 33 n=1 Tax=Phallusia mammillata TaxID=59560 RepID=A0A6F9DW48_9ASCI|nr:transmembrane protein 33 [Phallusia mammillata]